MFQVAARLEHVGDIQYQHQRTLFAQVQMAGRGLGVRVLIDRYPIRHRPQYVTSRGTSNCGARGYGSWPGKNSHHSFQVPFAIT